MLARSIPFASFILVLSAALFVSGGCTPTYTYKKANELPLKQVCDERANPRGELLMDADCGVQLTRMTAESACDAGNGEGCAMAALLTLTGKSVDEAVDLGRFPGDKDRARKLAERGCQRNNEASCLLEAVTLLQDRAPAKQMQGIRLMRQKCAQGMGDICYLMGSMFEENATTAQERTKSTEYYKESCQAENASGCYKYGQLLEDGFGVQQSHLRAKKYYERACDLNHADACAQVGRDLPEDHEEMLNEFARISKKSFLEMMRTGCENGFRHGCTFAGRLVDRGEIRTRYIGHETAVELFKTGCERGAAASCYYLAYKTKNGQGTQANTATAAKLAKKACDSGHDDACELHRDYTYRLFDESDAAATAKKCEAGDGRACYLAGHAYGYDMNFDADYERALELLQQGCELEYADACESAGVMLADDETGPHDLEHANSYYARGCELGADYACFALGMIYETGRGVETDFEASSRLLRVACERDLGQACGELGSYYEVGEAVSQDLAQAEELYSRGCSAGNINSCTNLASLLQRNTESRESFNRVFDLYKMSCANDEPRACVHLGNLLASFSDDKKLVSQGMDYLERSCMLDYGPGCRDFGVQFYRGESVKEDHQRALILWQQGCELEDSTSCIYLGELYRDGEGAEKDGERALEIFEEACSSENLVGCIRAAEMHLFDTDTDYAPEKAVEKYAEACSEGSDDACTSVASLFRTGVHVKQSFERTVDYLEEGCDGDLSQSCYTLEDFLRLGIGTEKDVERANELAAKRLEAYKEDCRENENASCAHAAHLIAHGRGTDTNWEEARKFLRAQCVHEVTAGCREQAEQKATGEIFERDRDAAISSLEELCEEGLDHACSQVAFFLRVGHTDEIDIARSTEIWTEQCKEDEHSTACMRLGNAYFHGLGVERDRGRGLAILEDTCTDTHRSGCLSYVVAKTLVVTEPIDGERYRRARLECSRKNWAACVRQGEMLASGRGVERSLSAAADAFERACESGSPSACPKANALSTRSADIERDAEGLILDCENDGTPESCVGAGLAAEFNVSEATTASRAADFYEKACAQDSSKGCQLRVALSEHNKVPLIGDEMYEYFEKSCKLGSPSYCYRLGTRFASHDWDVGVDMVQRACREEHTNACLWLNSNGEDPQL